MKSSKNRKVTFSSTSGEAKLLVMESDAEDMGEYRLEVSNEFGKVSQTCNVTVISKYFSLAYHHHHHCRRRRRRHSHKAAVLLHELPLTLKRTTLSTAFKRNINKILSVTLLKLYLYFL